MAVTPIPTARSGALGSVLFGGVEILKFVFPAAIDDQSPPRFVVSVPPDQITVDRFGMDYGYRTGIIRDGAGLPFSSSARIWAAHRPTSPPSPPGPGWRPLVPTLVASAGVRSEFPTVGRFHAMGAATSSTRPTSTVRRRDGWIGTTSSSRLTARCTWIGRRWWYRAGRVIPRRRSGASVP